MFGNENSPITTNITNSTEFVDNITANVNTNNFSNLTFNNSTLNDGNEELKNLTKTVLNQTFFENGTIPENIKSKNETKEILSHDVGDRDSNFEKDRIELKNPQKIDSNLERILDQYYNNEVGPDEMVELIIEFKDQSQNKLARNINFDYEQDIIKHKDIVKSILNQYEPDKSDIENKKIWLNTISIEDQEFISSHVEDIEEINEERRQQLFSILSTEIKKKQEPFIREVIGEDGQVKIQGISFNILVVEMPVRKIEEIISDNRVVNIQLNILYEDALAIDTSVYSIGADDLWDEGPGSDPIDEVAILDTGVTITHPSLKYRYDGTTVRTWYNKSFVAGEGYEDLNSHGTHVAGIVASSSVEGGTPDDVFKGVTYDIRKMINAKIGDSDGSIKKESIYNATDWVVYDSEGEIDNAEVTSNSYGFCDEWDGVPQDGEGPLAHFMDAVASNNNDVVIVFAAGNEGPTGSLCTPGDDSTLRHPADAYNVITVGATDDKNTTSRMDDEIAGYSSRGPTDDSRKKPDLVAPGTAIYSSDYDSSGFIAKSGTSMATPHVAAAAVWMMDYGLNALEIKALLVNTAEDINTTGWDKYSGWGYIDLVSDLNDLCYVSGFTDDDPKFFTINGVYEAERVTLTWFRNIEYDEEENTNGTAYDLSNLDLFLYDEEDNSLVVSSTSDIDNVEQIKSDISFIDTGIIKVKAVESFAQGVTTEKFAISTEGGETCTINPPSFTADIQDLGSRDCTISFNVSANITNNGNINAHDVDVTLNLPSGFSIVSGSNPQDIGRVNDSETKQASWQVQSSNIGYYNFTVNVESTSYGEDFDSFNIGTEQVFCEEHPITFSNLAESPLDLAVYLKNQAYQFGAIINSLDEIDTVFVEHNFTGNWLNDTAEVSNFSNLSLRGYDNQTIYSDDSNEEDIDKWMRDSIPAVIGLPGTPTDIVVNFSIFSLDELFNFSFAIARDDKLDNATLDLDVFNHTSNTFQNIASNFTEFEGDKVCKVIDMSVNSSEDFIYNQVMNFSLKLSLFHESGVGIEFDNITYSCNSENITVVPFHSRALIYARLESPIYILGKSDLAVGGYNYKWYANSTSGSENETELLDYTINKAQPEVNLILNGGDGDISVNINDTINITAYLIVGEIEMDLYVAEQLVASGDSPLQNITSFSNSGIYNVTAIHSVSQNFTISSETHFVNVSNPANIEIELIYPTTDINVAQNKFFNVTVNVSCGTNIDCEEINVSLDPDSSKTSIISRAPDLSFILTESGFEINGIKIEFFVKFNEVRYNFDTIPLEIKEQLGLFTSFKTERRKVKYNHTFNQLIKDKIERFGYKFPKNICFFNETTNSVYCNHFSSNSFIINFAEAKEKQRLNLIFSDDEFYFEGLDLSFIDPVIQATGSPDLPGYSGSDAIVKNSTGSLFVLYSNDSDAVVAISDDKGGTWRDSADTQLSCDFDTFGYGGALLINSTDAFFIVCATGDSEDDIKLIFSSDSGTSWSAPIQIYDNSDVSYTSLAGAIDSKDNLILCSGDDDSIDVFNSSDSGTSWSATIDVLTNTDNNCDIVANSTNGYHLIGLDIGTRDLAFATTIDPTSWGSTITVKDGTSYEDFEVSIGVSSLDHIFILTQKDNNKFNFSFYNSSDNGESWSEVTINTNSLNFGILRPNMVVDKRGDIHVIGDNQDPDVIFYTNSKNGGLSWSDPLSIETTLNDIQTPHLRGSNFPIFNDVDRDLDYVYKNLTQSDIYFGSYLIPKGLISATIGDIPFYTNESNPRAINLNANESELVTFWVNATGEIDATWKFFAYANLTSDLSVGNITPTINVTISGGELVPPNDTYKFIITNVSGDNVAWLGDLGNIVLKGTCTSGGTCNPPADSFILANLTSNKVAYIDSDGSMCIESVTSCQDSDEQASCSSPNDSFIILNETHGEVIVIDSINGDLCLTGKLYENAEL